MGYTWGNGQSGLEGSGRGTSETRTYDRRGVQEFIRRV